MGFILDKIYDYLFKVNRLDQVNDHIDNVLRNEVYNSFWIHTETENVIFDDFNLF